MPMDPTKTEVSSVSISPKVFSATTTSNASGGTALTITGGLGGSVTDTFASPRDGLVDDQTYYAIKVDDDSFKIATTRSNY